MNERTSPKRGDEPKRCEAASHGNTLTAKEWQHRLGGELLKGVSRSFYLTLRFLPGRVRGPISLGYLLARYADTLADTAAVPVQLRLQWLERFKSAVRDNADTETLQAALLERFAPFQEHDAEKRLLSHLRECLAWLQSETPFHREAIQDVLSAILHGQSLDCMRFGDPSHPRALANEQELDEYTYLVAGSVGEFWTRLCFHHWDTQFARASKHAMHEWGIRYGKGLQLINIVRDLPADLANGRCYLPADELRLHHVDSLIDPPPEALMTVCAKWENICETHFQHALDYCCAVKSPRLRYATGLPLLLGIRTLALLRNSDWKSRQKGVKVSRSEVKSILRKALVAQISTGKLIKLFRELGGS